MKVFLGKDTSIENGLKALTQCGVGAFLDSPGVVVYRDLIRQKLIGVSRCGNFPYPSHYETVDVDVATGVYHLRSFPHVNTAIKINVPPHIKDIVSLLHHYDFSGYVYIVGGYVRDFFLGRHTYDIDISVFGEWNRFVDIIAGAYSVKRFPLGIKFSAGEYKIDVSFSRFDYYVHPGKMPVVIPSSILSDLERRDFTIGSMAYLIYPYEGFIDPFYGMEDLHAKVLRFIRDYAPLEDPSRVLRGLRYESVLGFSFHHTTLDASHVAIIEKTPFIRSRRYFREMENLISAVGWNKFIDISTRWQLLKHLTGKMYATILRYINYVDSYKGLKYLLMLVYEQERIKGAYSLLGFTRAERKAYDKCKGRSMPVECLKKEGVI